jgi:endoglucanase
MKHQKYSFLFFVAIFIGLNACKKNTTTTGLVSTQPTKNNFVKTIGNKLFDSSGNALRLQGAAFGNEIWSNVEVPLTHHNEQDFIRLKAMKMNAVRFYLNYKTFESDNNPKYCLGKKIWRLPNS